MTFCRHFNSNFTSSSSLSSTLLSSQHVPFSLVDVSSGCCLIAEMSVQYTPPSSPSPPSFYDVSDDDEEEYSTIAQRDVKLLFSKSKVC